MVDSQAHKGEPFLGDGGKGDTDHSKRGGWTAFSRTELSHCSPGRKRVRLLVGRYPSPSGKLRGRIERDLTVRKGALLQVRK